jgi:hypothetical protein
MALDRDAFVEPLRALAASRLVPDGAVTQVLDVISENFAFAPALRWAESVHVHVNVDDVAAVPDVADPALPEAAVTRTPADVKYSFPGGLNVVFASEVTAQDELIDGAVTLTRPYVDHLGVDLRDDSVESRAVFEQIPALAAESGWRHVHQAGPVMCCYTATSEKQWIFPPDGPQSLLRPIEFAFGDLKTFDTHVGCDYRPIDPDHPLAAQACATAAPSPPQTVYIFEERSCNAGGGDELVDLFRTVYPDALVEAFDLAHPQELVPLPPRLFLALQEEGSRSLPSLVVDGAVFSQGWLPPSNEAVDFVRARALPDPRRRPGDASSECCAPSTAGTCC